MTDPPATDLGRSNLIRTGAFAVMLSSSTALAEVPMVRDGDEAMRHYSNMRLGAATSDSVGRPTICLEIGGAWGLSVEGCGTGSGFLHREEGQEIAHFRAKWVAYELGLGAASAIRLQPGAGFAELEVGIDEPGFRFGEPRPGAPSTAGPEASMSAQYLRGVGGGLEFTVNMTVGTAWFPGAPKLDAPQGALQPFASAEIGIGF